MGNVCVRCHEPILEPTVTVGRRRDGIMESVPLHNGITVSREGIAHWGYTRDDKILCPKTGT